MNILSFLFIIFHYHQLLCSINTEKEKKIIRNRIIPQQGLFKIISTHVLYICYYNYHLMDMTDSRSMYFLSPNSAKYYKLSCFVNLYTECVCHHGNFLNSTLSRCELYTGFHYTIQSMQDFFFCQILHSLLTLFGIFFRSEI